MHLCNSDNETTSLEESPPVVFESSQRVHQGTTLRESMVKRVPNVAPKDQDVPPEVIMSAFQHASRTPSSSHTLKDPSQVTDASKISDQDPSAMETSKNLRNDATVKQDRGQEIMKWICVGLLVLVFLVSRYRTETKIANMASVMAKLEGHIETMEGRFQDMEDSFVAQTEEMIYPLDATVYDLYSLFDSEMTKAASVLSDLQSHLERQVESKEHEDAQRKRDMELGELLKNSWRLF